MYAKLIWRNARRSVGDYLIYLVTVTICVTLFYSFLSVSSRYYQPEIGSEYDFTMLSDGMKLAICAITLFLLFLIRFVNNYMLRRRQKEFAVQAILGMERRTIAGLFFAETLLMGFLATGIGIFLGVFCSQLITAMLMTSYGQEYEITWTLFPDTVLLTICFFTLSFLVVGIFNVRAIGKARIIDMLQADRENGPKLAKSRWMPAVTILYEAFLFWMAAAGIQKLYFYYDSRYTLPVQIVLWGNALLPVMILAGSGVWWLRRKRAGFQKLISGLLLCSVLLAALAAGVPVLVHEFMIPLGAGTVNQYLLFILADLLYGICSIIYLAGSFLTAWKESSAEHRYRNENLFFYGQMISKLNTTSKTMTLVSITLMLSICLLLASPVLVGWASGYLAFRSMYDIQIYTRYNDVYEEENLPDGDYEMVTEFLTENRIEIAHDRVFSLYLPRRTEFHERIKYDFPAVAISLSDYNAIRTMLGFAPVSLKENEFTTQWAAIASEEEQNAFLEDHAVIETDAGKLALAQQASHEEAMGLTLYNTYTNVLLVFPDQVCQELLSVMRNRYILTREPVSYEDARQLEEEFTAVYPEVSDTGVSYGIRLRTLQVNGTRAGNFVLQASMIYGGIVLMVVCMTILSLQQLLDAAHYRYRFSVLRKLGVEENRMGRLLLKQLGIWFGLPVAVAILVSSVVLVFFMEMVSGEISAYIGFDRLLSQIIAVGSVLLVLLVCYFTSTWLLFRRLIAPEN